MSETGFRVDSPEVEILSGDWKSEAGADALVQTEHQDFGTSYVYFAEDNHSVVWQVKANFWTSREIPLADQGAVFQDVIRNRLASETRYNIFVGTASHSLASRAGGHELPAAKPLRRLTTGREASAKSPWADAIGPLYSVEGAAAENGVTAAAIRQGIELGVYFAIVSTDGDALLPAMQFDTSGAPVCGLKRLLERLPSSVIDGYSLAAWMNRPHISLADRSPWQVLRAGESEGARGELVAVVESLRKRMKQ